MVKPEHQTYTMTDYTHEELDKEVQFISGYYSFVEEGLLAFKGKEVLYVVGIAVVDNSCCGIGGGRFIRIPGYVISWKSAVNKENRPMSTIDPITDTTEQREIKKLLQVTYPHSTIEFDYL
jgi:hypothetical protein